MRCRELLPYREPSFPRETYPRIRTKKNFHRLWKFWLNLMEVLKYEQVGFMSQGDAKYKKYHNVNLLATVKLDTRSNPARRCENCCDRLIRPSDDGKSVEDLRHPMTRSRPCLPPTKRSSSARSIATR